MHSTVLGLFLLPLCLAATESGETLILPQTLQSPDRKEDITLVKEKSEAGNETQLQPETNGIFSTEASEGIITQKEKGLSAILEAQHENNTTPRLDIVKSYSSQHHNNSSVQDSAASSYERNQTYQQEIFSRNNDKPLTPDEVKQQNIVTQFSQEQSKDNFTKELEPSTKANHKERENVSDVVGTTEQQTQGNTTRKVSEGQDRYIPKITEQQTQANSVQYVLPKASHLKQNQATSLKDFFEVLPDDTIKPKQVNDSSHSLRSAPNEDLVESVQLLKALRDKNIQKQQSSSVILSLPIQRPRTFKEERHIISADDRRQGIEDQQSAQISSPEKLLVKKEYNRQTYYDPDLYERSEFVTTNNALDLKSPIATHSGFTPSFPIRSSVPQYAVKEEHLDDLAPHHFGVNVPLPYPLDRTQFAQYQQAAKRVPLPVRFPQRQFTVSYPVLLERKDHVAHSFSLPLKVLVQQTVPVQEEDKVPYTVTEPFTFNVQHVTTTPAGEVEVQLGQRGNSRDSYDSRQHGRS